MTSHPPHPTAVALTAPPPSLDDRLDEALKESFPASDPIAVFRPERSQ